MIKGKTLSKHIINGSGQMPTLCELPDPKIGAWKVTLCVDDVENGKKGAALKVGQKCAVVQGLSYEVRGAKVEKADIECSNGVIHVIDSVMIPGALLLRALLVACLRSRTRYATDRREVLRRLNLLQQHAAREPTLYHSSIPILYNTARSPASQAARRARTHESSGTS